MDIKKLIKLQNAIIRAHQKIKDVQDDADNQTKEIKDEFKKEFNGLNKALEQLNEELSSFTKKEDTNKQSEELERIKNTIDELNTTIDDKISKIQLKHGKDGRNGIDGKDGYTPIKGKDYFDGKSGRDGKDGRDGLSAYEIAVKQGYEGTEEEWIEHITNNGGRSYDGQIAAMNQRLNKVSRTIKTDGKGDKYLADDGTYKTVSGTGEVPEDVLTQSSILRTIEECEQCTGESVPAASLLAMTYNSIPKTVSELENDEGFVSNSDLSNYYTKDEIDAEAENIYELISQKGIIDLGIIDVDEYDGDYLLIMDTLTETGTYKYIDNDDEFTWYVIVYNLGSTVVQTYFSSEEGYNNQYTRIGYLINDNEYEWEDWTSVNASKINYIDNGGNNVYNVQDALDKAFEELAKGTGGGLIDLGTIDIDEYDGEVYLFMNTLTETGTYKFRDSYDEFAWYLTVYNLDWSVVQTYFNSEEGYNVQNTRIGYSNGDDYDWEEWTDANNATNVFYEDNYGRGAYNVQDALDNVFDTLDNLPSGGSGVIDLGFVDIENDYDWDHDAFISTLTEEGTYTFQDNDGLTRYVEVKVADGRVGQTLWGNEEGYLIQHFRDGWLDGDEYSWSDWNEFIFESDARSWFANKNHTHYETATGVKDIREWLDTNQAAIVTASNTPVKEIYVSKTNYADRYVVRAYTTNTSQTRYHHQEYFSFLDPSKIYKRVGTVPTSGSSKISWGSWYVYQGIEEE